MSAGVFEVIAADQSQQVVAGRKAVALASKRVNERFSRFLLASENAEDLKTRLDFVRSDIDGVVQSTCQETGYENGGSLLTAIVASYTGHEKFVPQQRTASTQHEARRPKMCPYHKEVVDISLSAGEAKAGYEAMAGHAWGKNHCDGEFEGSCNFRREMVTQSWWDDRDKALQERREQREQERSEQAEQESTQLEQVDTPEGEPQADTEAPTFDTTETLEETPEPVSEAPVAPEGVDGVEAEVPMAMAASFQRTAEATKTIDVARRTGPVPKIDKSKWTPENLQQRIETEGKGSPNPTKHKDVVQPITQDPDNPDNSKKLTEIGEQTTEQQDVSKDSGPKPSDAHTWPSQPTTAVSSVAPDVNTNPLQAILESDYDGFIPYATVQSALAKRG